MFRYTYPDVHIWLVGWLAGCGVRNFRGTFPPLYMREVCAKYLVQVSRSGSRCLVLERNFESYLGWAGVKQIVYLNSLVHFSPVTIPVHCRLMNVEGGGLQSVEREKSGVLSRECSV